MQSSFSFKDPCHATPFRVGLHFPELQLFADHCLPKPGSCAAATDNTFFCRGHDCEPVRAESGAAPVTYLSCLHRELEGLGAFQDR